MPRLAALPHAGPQRARPGLAAARLTAGPGTLMDAVLRAAGLTNASEGGRVGLEALLRHPPDLLVVATAPGLSRRWRPSCWTIPRSPSLRRRAIPPALTICAGPFTAEAAALLAQ